MTDASLQTLSGIAQAVVALAALIASIAIPAVLHRGQKRRETLEFVRAVRDMWMTFDALGLQNPELLLIADQFLAPDAKGDASARKKTWLGLMIINIVYMDFLGAVHGLHEKEASHALEPLRAAFLDNEIYELTQRPGAYDAAFQEFCRKFRTEIGSVSTS